MERITAERFEELPVWAKHVIERMAEEIAELRIEQRDVVVIEAELPPRTERCRL